MSHEGRAREPIDTLTGAPARFYHAEGDRLRCELCPRACLVGEGQRAFCFVRANRGGQMVLTTYGRSSGFCVDPIEKKPLNHFYPGSSILSFGTAGCNLGCKFCQNWDISKARDSDRLQVATDPAAIARAARDHGCSAVAFTYNDPVIFAEWAIDVAAACREVGVKTVAVTAGYVTPAARPEFFAAMDAANVDLKGFTEGFYRRLCAAELGPVKDTLAWLARETSVWLEVTTLLIPGENDSPAEIDAMTRWYALALGPEVPLHFTAYHPDYKLDAPATPSATLVRARQQALDAGIRHVYTGNVHDTDGQSTYCAGCGTRVIERDWYQLGAWHLDERGACRSCGRALAGRFAARPGTWGPKRLRVVP